MTRLAAMPSLPVHLPPPRSRWRKHPTTSQPYAPPAEQSTGAPRRQNPTHLYRDPKHRPPPRQRPGQPRRPTNQPDAAEQPDLLAARRTLPQGGPAARRQPKPLHLYRCHQTDPARAATPAPAALPGAPVAAPPEAHAPIPPTPAQPASQPAPASAHAEPAAKPHAPNRAAHGPHSAVAPAHLATPPEAHAPIPPTPAQPASQPAPAGAHAGLAARPHAPNHASHGTSSAQPPAGLPVLPEAHAPILPIPPQPAPESPRGEPVARPHAPGRVPKTDRVSRTILIGQAARRWLRQRKRMHQNQPEGSRP